MSFRAARMTEGPFGTTQRATALSEDATLSNAGGKTA